MCDGEWDDSQVYYFDPRYVFGTKLIQMSVFYYTPYLCFVVGRE